MPHKIKVMIVDDEAIARRRLVRFLETEPDVEIVSVCADGPEAIAATPRVQPDVLFLDVQMPGMTGFDVLSRLGATPPVHVVFVTAYDEHAVRAFDIGALDYLLKPFGPERFGQAFERVRTQLRHQRGDYANRLAAYLEGTGAQPAGREAASLPGPWLDRLMVKDGGRAYFVRAAEIDWVESADNYVRIHVGKDAHLLRQTLTSLEANLDPRRFARVHRCALVNLDSILEIHRGVGRDRCVILKNGAELPLSDRYRERLEASTRPRVG